MILNPDIADITQSIKLIYSFSDRMQWVLFFKIKYFNKSKFSDMKIYLKVDVPKIEKYKNSNKVIYSVL